MRRCLHMPAAWIVPGKQGSELWVRPDATHYRDAKAPLLKKAVIDMPWRAKHWIDIERDRLVYAHDGHLIIHQSLSNNTAASKIKLPGKPNIHALHVVNNVVFTGADAGKSMLGYLDLQDPTAWHAIAVSNEVNWTGKGVDGFAVYQSRLIAIDDIVLPRYLLLLDITNPRDPKWIEHRNLPAHSSYERVQAVESNDEIVVLLSTSANHGASSIHIAFMDLETLEEYATLSVQGPMSMRKWAERSYDFRGIAMQGNRLLVAANADGLGILPLPTFPPDFPVEPNKKAKRATPLSSAPQISADAIQFIPVSAGPVVDVVAVDENQAFVIVEIPGNGFFKRTTFDSVLVPLPRTE